ncbi:MAG TPA: T9SS type A sorting domain-containing protein, partial [Bacteroidales bacterium]|nr:T9SS type A sorting domain-containing protein [Bacteroidales bacterium]
ATSNSAIFDLDEEHPASVTIVDGINTNSITVNFSDEAGSGIINVNGLNSCGKGQVSPNLQIIVNPVPKAPVIELKDNSIISSAASGNQWYYNDKELAGETSGKVVPEKAGSYYSIVTEAGCSSSRSNIAEFEVANTIDETRVGIYPVPSTGNFTVKIDPRTESEEMIDVQVYNSLGNKVFEKPNVIIFGKTLIPFELENLPAGKYYIRFISKKGQVIKTLILSR